MIQVATYFMFDCSIGLCACSICRDFHDCKAEIQIIAILGTLVHDLCNDHDKQYDAVVEDILECLLTLITACEEVKTECTNDRCAIADNNYSVLSTIQVVYHPLGQPQRVNSSQRTAMYCYLKRLICFL